MESAAGPVHSAAAGLYLLTLLFLLPFGVHRLRLLWLRMRHPPLREAREWSGPLPRVTVQLPVYNEANVIERAIDAACGLEYPRERLEVQVLDDSDDETVALAAERVRSWRRRGVDVQHVRRGERTGFKAGALALGARRARGDFFLVLDADFVPPSDLVRRLLPPFRDERVGAVQAAWGHLNEDESWLTRGQALMLDAHFTVEHETRYRCGLFFNFNGTAGMWRRRCLEDAGGWRADTLTEDLDLSYRAQLRGWRLAYLDEVRVPAELPSRVEALEVQQQRWAQGGIQTARKLLPAVWRSPARPSVKIEATAHLLAHAAHPPTLLLGAALGALGLLGTSTALLPTWAHLTGLGLAMFPFLLFYAVVARLRGHGPVASARRVAETMLLGLGLGVPVTFAVLRGLREDRTPFRRTPKLGSGRALRAYGVRRDAPALLLRAALALGLGAAMTNLIVTGTLPAVPFTGLFAAGHAATTRESFRGHDRRRSGALLIDPPRDRPPGSDRGGACPAGSGSRAGSGGGGG